MQLGASENTHRVHVPRLYAGSEPQLTDQRLVNVSEPEPRWKMGHPLNEKGVILSRNDAVGLNP
jgi:hypothetical protein